MGRITRQHDEDYEFFVNRMTRGKIPTLLVLTGCENEEPMNAWVQENGTHYAPFTYRRILATCFATGGALEAHFAPLRQQSGLAMLDAINECALPEPYKLYGTGTSDTFTSKLASLWNDFVELAGLPATYRAKVNESAYEFLKRIGVPEKLAEAAIKHIPDLIGDLPVPARRILKNIGRRVLEAVLRPAR